MLAVHLDNSVIVIKKSSCAYHSTTKGLNISCRYGGVFHVEKNHRYSLTKEDAIALCKALNSTIPTWEQMKNAFELGFETCRYGYIEDKIVVPRHTPYHLCAANNTGIYVLSSNISDRYDTYCFNSSETRNKTCEPVIKLYSAWPNNESTIEIFNADGSRYIKGEKFTEQPPVTDDEISAGSGSATDRSTTDPNLIRHGISQYPHTADDVTSLYHAGRDDEEGGDRSRDQHLQRTREMDKEIKSLPSVYINKLLDESSEENDDDGGGDDGDDNEEGSGHINPETLIEWDNSGDQELQPSNTNIRINIHPTIVTTAVVSSKDVKHEDSTHDPLLNGVYSGRDSEVKYSTNGTREDVPHGIAHLGDAGHYSTASAVSTSNDFSKQEDSNEHSLDGSQSGLETEDTVHTPTISSDILHPGLVPSSEKESTLENESFHHTVTFFNESAEHEGSHQDQLQPMGKPGRKSEMSHSANRTIHGVLEILVPPSEHVDDEDTSSQTVDVVSNNGIKHQEVTENPLSYDVHSEWTIEDPTYTSNKTILPGSHQPPSEMEHKNESLHTVVDAAGNIHHEDSSNNMLIHGIHSSWSHEDRYPANPSRDDILLGIISSNENKHEEDSEKNHTAVASSDNGKREDHTQDPLLPHGMHPGWDSERDLLMNATRDDVPSETIPSNEIMYENEISHTVMISNDGDGYEDSTQIPLTDRTHPSWTSEPRHPTNASKDDWVPGIILPIENVHGKESSHTVTGSSDDFKPEDTTHNLVMHEQHHEIGREDKYPTNSTENEISVDIVPPTGHNNEEKIFHTVAIHNTLEDSTQPPIHEPGWETEEKYSTNTSRDGVLVGIDTDSESEHHPLDTAVLATDESKNEEPTHDSSLNEMNPGQSNEGEHLLNNTREYMIPGVFSEVDSGSDRQPSSSDSSSPGGHGRGVSRTGNVTPLPGESPKPQKRMAYIPDWLIVVASLLALALILGVCIAVNSRRRCGQRKKLMINNGKGGIDEKNKGGLNGEASKSHEMVNLVQKEKPEDQTDPQDEFLAIDETQNQQDVALKSGV
ncbi:hypothetical protein JD844_021569 [Phrynosoma platyrhinos]|uniref:CD44 antigen n=1 Tax=Phrynosoma platyrhinos TaxID=52577 RepID=A0ABQ7SU60_PHRPL|nr:hypothetical protein JD844_021569 [Phrynosoma platyrhinos]